MDEPEKIILEQKFPLKEELIEHVDYYWDGLGRWVFTEKYHLKRGFCCQNRCKHCPYKAGDRV